MSCDSCSACPNIRVVLSQLSLTKLWSVQLSLNKLIGREQPAIHNFASDNRTKTRRKIKQRKRHSNIFIKNQSHKRRKQKWMISTLFLKLNIKRIYLEKIKNKKIYIYKKMLHIPFLLNKNKTKLKTINIYIYIWHNSSSSIYKKEQFLHRFNVKEKIYKPLKNI